MLISGLIYMNDMMLSPHSMGLSFFGDHSEAHNGSFIFIVGFLLLIVGVYRWIKAKKILKLEIEAKKHKPTKY